MLGGGGGVAGRVRPIGRMALAGSLLAVASFASPGGGDPAAELERSTRRNERLRVLVEASDPGDLPYLVLDAEQEALRLMLDAVVLREYPVRLIEIGHPRVLYVFEREPAADWLGRVWTNGQVDPQPDWQRRELIPPAAETATPQAEPEEQEPVVIPPTVDEAYPAPPRYRVRYEGGLTLEITGDPGAAQGLSERLRDVATALLPGGEALRVRVVIAAEDAAALYRSLPTDGRLVVLPPA